MCALETVGRQGPLHLQICSSCKVGHLHLGPFSARLDCEALAAIAELAACAARKLGIDPDANRDGSASPSPMRLD